MVQVASAEIEAERNAAREAAEKAEKEKVDDGDGGQAPGVDPPDQPDVPDAPVEIPETTEMLSSSVTDFTFTSKGGGIATARLKEHESSHSKEERVILNEYANFPVGALSREVGSVEKTPYTIRKADNAVVLEGRTEDNLQVRKTFVLRNENEPGGAYSLDFRLDLTNADPEKRFTTTNADVPDPNLLFLSVGTAAPGYDSETTHTRGFLWYRNGKGKIERVGHYKKPRDPVVSEKLLWAGVNNQFFHTSISAAEPYDGLVWGARELVAMNKGEVPDAKVGGPDASDYAVIGALGLPKIDLAPGESKTFEFRIFMGPKEYTTLKGMGRHLDSAMRYNDLPVFGWLAAPFSRILMGLLTWIHSWSHNYGVAILIITLIIRIAIWPLHHKAQRSMKRMAKLSPMMTEIREKHKEDPQKMNAEMMGLYRDYGVNPFGGCLPMLLQMPIFLGFFQMLRSAAELRHQDGGPAFWVDDLSMPDTVARVIGIPINPLPLLMAVTMILQMKMTPQTGDKMQRRIFMFMPLIFLAICYNFASALALYWTAQNIISIGQTWITRKLPEPELKKKPKPAPMQQRGNPMNPYEKPKKPKKSAPRTGGSRRKRK